MLVQRRKTIQAMAGIAGLVAGALVMVPGPSQATPSVLPSRAGTIEVWGATGSGSSGTPVRITHDSASGPWTAVTLSNDGNDFGITSTKTLKRLSGTDSVVDIPAAVASAQVKAVSANSLKVAVVKADGSVQIWGDTVNVPAQTLTPATLGAKAVDVQVGAGAQLIAILLDDGRVVAVRNDGFDHVETEPGTDLTGAVEIAAYYTNGIVRINGGGVFAFNINGDPTGVPAAISGDNLADPVVSLAMNAAGAIATTASGAVTTWNIATGEVLTNAAAIFPDSEAEGKVIDVSVSLRYFAALTDDQEVIVWGQTPTARDYTKMRMIPEEVGDKRVADLVGSNYTFAAVVSGPIVDLAEKTKPTISGTAKVNSTLTGTPATFDGPPDEITNKWLADGTAISGATGTTYKLTAAELGKTITFESTATRVEDSASLASTSTSVGPILPEGAIASSTVVSAPSRAYGSTGTATVTVTNAGGLPVTGTVTLSGAGAAQTKAVVGGKASFSLAKTLAPKAYTLTARYNGSAQVSPSARAIRYTVVKGKVRSVSYKTTKTPTSKKKGKATVTVTAPSGLAKATGKVTVTLKKGSSKKTIKATLSSGKKSITLPKLKKGTYKVTVSYAGDSRYASAKSKTYTLKVKK